MLSQYKYSQSVTVVHVSPARPGRLIHVTRCRDTRRNFFESSVQQHVDYTLGNSWHGIFNIIQLSNLAESVH